MGKQPAPSSTTTWWLDPPPVIGWFKRCYDQFDVRLSRKIGKPTLTANSDATSKALGKTRSHGARQSSAGIRRTSGFGITERSPHFRGTTRST